MKDVKRWLAVYTKPRWEKKVFLQLTEGGVECYCPLNKVRKKWSDRIKMVEEPLFKSYVFVNVNNKQVQEIKTVSGVLNFVHWLGKPAVIKQVEIDRIRKFLNEHDNIALEPLDLKANDNVLITSGILMDQHGRVLRKIGNRVELEIIALGYRLVAQVERKNIVRATVPGQKTS
jgi:transcription antitermination factor NusG